MLRLTAAAVFVLCACREAEVMQAKSELTVQPLRLDFPDTELGQTSSLDVELNCRGTVDREVAVSADAPFSLTTSSLTLPASASAPLSVRFAPVATGAVTGTLRLTSEGDVLEVGLAGTGVEPAVCTTPLQCRLCGGANAPNGTACESPCLEQASCVEGVCVGTPKVCDDGDRCTADACDAALGCTHTAVTCSEPADPCRVGQCDPVSGCTTSAAADGTRCGANDCAVAHVCMAGVCVERPPPEGSRCGEATPCQPAPTCQAGKCVKGPVTPLQPAWSVTAPNGTRVTFPGTSDAAGNLYWFESRSSVTDLVSYDRSGALRFRVTVSGRPARFSSYPIEESPLVLVSEQHVLAVIDEGAENTPTRRVELHSALDGALVWSAGRAELAPAIGLAAGLPLYVMSAGATSGTGRVILNLRTNAGGAAWSSWIVSLDGATGTVQWTWRNTYLSASVIDEQGTVFVYEDLFVHALYAIDAAGAQAWRISQTNWSAMPSATHRGLVYTSFPSRLFAAADGGVLSELAPSWGREPLVGFGHVISTENSTFCSRTMTSVNLASPATPAGAWSAVPAGCFRDPVLTSRATVLVGTTQTSSGEAGSLYEYSLDGGPLFTCPLEQPLGQRSALIDDAWVSAGSSTVSLYALPGLKLAPHGWVTQAGGRARAKTPQP
ncbi:MAG: hypothetical protein JNK82_41710 [Myxococcaceae bacterium]|nr:hypothetical protein [Myxococcaceae bacterium]